MRPHLVRLAAGLVAGAVVFGGCLAETVVYRGVEPGLFALPTAALVVGVVLAPLLPWLGMLGAAASFPLQVLAAPDSPGIGGIALVTMMVLVAHGARRLPTRVSAPGAVLAALGGASGSIASGSPWFELVFFGATMGGAWLVGSLLRRESRRGSELARLADELAVERERSTRLAVVEERSRISRELHDAVAHSVAVMTLQAGVVRRRLERLDAADAEVAALRSVEDLGRRSVDELRRVVGVLREDDDDASSPAPSLTDLDDLVARLAGAGLTVSVRVVGEPGRLAPATDVSAHRIVAEALTNVLRHAGTDRAEVTVTWENRTVAVEVTDRGSGSGAGDPTGGHGLVHLRERALMAGGTLAAGPRPDGGFAVRVVLPVLAVEVATP
ncbi:sensor histidine kinase [Actinomycetospora atypica]|uniref:histidine kinase n=1 Tax=Actinomycetospora atypica TaxID=1290095 RepID=A0ABV9YIF7_9PSEU